MSDVPDDFEMTDAFRAAWAKKEAAGYRYGRDALEAVRFGFEKIQWVCELLVRENPRKYSARTLAESCGWDRGPTDRALADLWQRGLIKINGDSSLEQGDYVEETTPEGHSIRYRRGATAYGDGI